MQYNTELKINPEFRDLIPPLILDEYKGLEESLIAEGCRDAIVVWGETIIDGHNRYAICKENRIPFETSLTSFADESDAKIWIINNQLSRRNITGEQRDYLIGKRYKQEKKQVGAPIDNKNAEKQSGQNVPIVSTAEKIAIQHEISEKAVRRDEQFADGVDAIAQVAPEIKREILAGKSEMTKGEVSSFAKATPEEAAAKIEEIRKPHVSNNSGNNEWYTPAEFIESARYVLGEIDLDPASNELANETVKADKYFTVEDDGLAQEWRGRVWLNPPYSSDLVSRFADKAAAEYAAKRMTEAIVLLNNATETGWFNTFINIASAVVFPRTRIRYLTPDGVKNSPLQGQAFVYIGNNHAGFLAEFSGYGWGAVVNG